MGICLAHFHSRAILDQGARCFAYISLIIEFKGMVMKLKNASIQFPWNSLFFDISQLVISLQTLLGQTSPMPWVKGLKQALLSQEWELTMLLVPQPYKKGININKKPVNIETHRAFYFQKTK